MLNGSTSSLALLGIVLSWLLGNEGTNVVDFVISSIFVPGFVEVIEVIEVVEVVGVVEVVEDVEVVEVAVVVEVVEVVGVIIDDADTIESTAAPPTTFLFVVLRTPQSKDSLCNKFSTFSKTCWEVGLLSGSAVIHMVNNSIKRSLY